MRTLLLLLPTLVLFGQTPAPKAPKTPVKTATSAAAAKPAANYKEIGSPSAPLRFEAYTDYECPHCARFFKEIVPNLMEQYVRTGKVLFVHRDFILPQLIHSEQAARYANAAGELGQYELVVNQLFKTQDDWGIEGKNTGNVDGAVAQVLAPGVMQKVRELVKSDPRLDETVKKDVAMGNNVDHVNSTPTLVIVTKSGKRQVISAALAWSVWKNYLDEELAK